MATLQARDFRERSPLHHRHAGATLGGLGNSVIVTRYGADDQRRQLQRCALLDLSNLARVGFRGAQSADYLRQRGYQLPQAPNQALTQTDGSRVARLSQNEYLLLGGLRDAGARIAREEADWQFSEQANYLLPRQDSHAWLLLTGACGPEVLAKLFSPVRSSKVGQNRGIGLSIVHNLVKKLDGLISCQSTGEGTAFEILLPARNAAAQGAAALSVKALA